MVALARRSVTRAGALVEVAQRSIQALEGTDPPGTVIVNPPYGERMQASRALFDAIAASLGALPRGHRVALLLGPATPISLPREASRFRVQNGQLDCTLACWVT